MPIKITNNQEINAIELKIDNGDFRALNQIKESYGFRDVESVLKFAIAIFMLANGTPVHVETNGELKPYVPTEALLEQRTPEKV